MIKNTDNLFYDLDEQIPLVDKIDEFRNSMKTSERKRFDDDFDEQKEHYMEYVVRI